MTPVMDRCACPAAYLLAECVTCTPTPPEGLYPDHRQPIPPPAPRAPVDDLDGLAQPISAGYVLGGWAALGLAAWGVVGLVVWGVCEIGAWVVGRLA
jgi:hypothetical protein